MIGYINDGDNTDVDDSESSYTQALIRQRYEKALFLENQLEMQMRQDNH